MGKRLLILDNDPDVLEVMQEVFLYEGFEVRTLEYTTNIFNEIEDYKPDVIMLDYILNGINGGEICHQIKTNELTCTMPVVIVSAYTKVINSLGYYGCDSFIPKPFDLSDLVSKVNKLLGISDKTGINT
jgi:DNA-binding response OmpR family regulator